MIFESNVTFGKHINAVIKSGVSHVQLHAETEPLLCVRAFHRAVHVHVIYTTVIVSAETTANQSENACEKGP